MFRPILVIGFFEKIGVVFLKFYKKESFFLLANGVFGRKIVISTFLEV